MLFLDTSALLKRYVAEEGTERVLALMAGDDEWCASELALAEASTRFISRRRTGCLGHLRS